MHLLEFPYYLGLSAKKFFALKSRKRLPCRVISVGNLTTGGTGKTPCTIALAREALRRGLRPVVLTRGYRGSVRGPAFVSRGEGPLMSVEEAGDEPFLMARQLSGVPIVKGGDRYAAGLYAMQHLSRGGEPSALVFILDDGFQHWGLHRDEDILLIDSINPFDTRRLLPLGRLREPMAAIGRADVIVLTRVEKSDSGITDITFMIRRYNPEAPIFLAKQTPLYCRMTSGEEKPAGWLSGKRLYAFCGIGNPESFRRSLISEGGIVVGFGAFRDHHAYRERDLVSVEADARNAGAQWIVTTEKDIIKIGGPNLPERLVVIGSGFTVDAGFYVRVFDRR